MVTTMASCLFIYFVFPSFRNNYALTDMKSGTKRPREAVENSPTTVKVKTKAHERITSSARSPSSSRLEITSKPILYFCLFFFSFYECFSGLALSKE